MAGIHVKFNISPEDFLAHLTEAAYDVALKYGLSAPFIDVELDMMNTLRAVLQRDMSVTAYCNMTPECREAVRVVPFSKESEVIFPDVEST